MSAKALEVHLSSPVDDGQLWQVGTRKGKGIPFNINIVCY